MTILHDAVIKLSIVNSWWSVEQCTLLIVPVRALRHSTKSFTCIATMHAQYVSLKQSINALSKLKLTENFLDQVLIVIAYRYSSSSCSSCPRDLHQKTQGVSIFFKSDPDESWRDRYGTRVNAHRLSESDFGYDVIRSRWRPLRPFTQHSSLLYCHIVSENERSATRLVSVSS